MIRNRHPFFSELLFFWMSGWSISVKEYHEKKSENFFITESHKRFSFSNSSIHKSPVWQYFKEVAKKRTISPFLRTTIFRWCEKNFFSRRKGCGSFFIHLGRRWSYPIFNFKTNESSRNFCGGGSCYTWQWEFHHHTPRYGVWYTLFWGVLMSLWMWSCVAYAHIYSITVST